jgi:Flp pilus assembly protein TadD
MARRVLICLALAALTIFVYRDVYRFAYVNFDDSVYVPDNPHVITGISWENIRWAFTTSYAANWIPLTWLSLMFDAEFWGAENAGGFHVTNALLHVANSLVLFLLLESMTGAAWRSAFVSALFAVHPLHVESVAWVTERKDMLSTFFALLSIGAYLSYTRENRKSDYVLSLVLFAASLMSKQMFVTMPALILLLDYWPLERFRRTSIDQQPQTFDLPPTSNDEPPPPLRERAGVGGNEQSPASIPTPNGAERLGGSPATKAASSVPTRQLILEKIPFAVLAGIAAIIVFLVQQQGGTVQSFMQIPFGMRLSNAAISSIEYLGKTFWPVNLAVFYPYQLVVSESGTTVDVCLFCGVTSALLLMGATIIAFILGRWWKFVLFGWLWYLVALLPVIGIIQVGSQRMADRYTYVPLIGPFIAVAWLLAGPQGAEPVRKTIASLVAVASVAVLAVMAHTQASYWQDSIALFEHAVAVTGPNATARTNLGLALSKAGRTDEAIDQLRRAVEIDPNYAIAQNNLGVLLQPREPDVALAAYQKAIAIDPSYATAHANLGNALFQRGDFASAEKEYRRALVLEPENPEFLIGLARLLRATKRHDEAAFQLQAACRVAPRNSTAHMELGIVLFELGRTKEGLEHLRESVHWNEESATARQNLAAALFAEGHLDDAIEQYQEALRIKPDFVAAQQGLKAALDAKAKGEQVR